MANQSSRATETLRTGKWPFVFLFRQRNFIALCLLDDNDALADCYTGCWMINDHRDPLWASYRFFSGCFELIFLIFSFIRQDFRDSLLLF